MPRSLSPKKTADDLPHPLTFFLTKAQRREVTAALRSLHRDRPTALLRALNLAASRSSLPAARPAPKVRS